MDTDDVERLRTNLVKYGFADSGVVQVLLLLDTCVKRKTEFLLRLMPNSDGKNNQQKCRSLKEFRIEARNR